MHEISLGELVGLLKGGDGALPGVETVPGSGNAVAGLAFSDVLEDQQLLLQQLQRLKDQLQEQLDPQLLSQLQLLLPDGNLLPLTATLGRPLATQAGAADEVATVVATEPAALADAAGDRAKLAAIASRPSLPRGLGEVAEKLGADLLPDESTGAQDALSGLSKEVAPRPALVLPDPAVASAASRRLATAVLGGEPGAAAPAPVLLSADPGAPPGNATASLPDISVPPNAKGWDQAVGERVVWMLGQHVDRAEIRLNPPHLGPIEIRVAVQNEQASVSFSAHHAVTREAIDAAIPRLREMLGQSSLNLVNVDVGHREASGDGRFEEPAGRQASRVRRTDGVFGPEEAPATRRTRVSRGVLDTYA